MVSNLEIIQKTEEKAKKIVADAHQKATETKHKAFDKVSVIKKTAFEESQKEVALIKQKAVEEAEAQASKIKSEAKQQSAKLYKAMEKNIEEASDFIVRKVLGGSS